MRGSEAVGTAEQWVSFSKSVGAPTLILLVFMYGVFMLLKPVSNEWGNHLVVQTTVLHGVEQNVTKSNQVTTQLLELMQMDASERKADMLKEIQETVKDGFSSLELSCQQAIHEHSRSGMQ